MRSVLACLPQQQAATPRLVFGAGLAGPPPFHTPTLLTAVASTKVRMQWMAGVMQVLGLSAADADPACAGPGDALPSFSMRPPSTPSALLNKLWQLARVTRATASPWTVVEFWVLLHMQLCRQSWLWCVAASGCLLLLHYILHISVVCVLQCLVPPCTPQPVCESSVVCSQLHELVVVQHQASLTHA
jgi:hypothetical protein